jgi:probable rRNA maturation factor
LEDCRRFAAAALRELGAADWELSILVCTDPFIRSLNRRYRGLDEPTDVLSFSQDSPPGARGQRKVAGDIVISLDTLARNAEREGESRETELKRLLIHGMLHLQGLDHPEEGDSEMLRLQESLLERLREKRIEL